MAVEFILLTLVAYLLGSVPAAYLAARWSRRIDIRHYGSSNVGATNVWEFTSKWVAIPVIAFDLVKGMVMIWAAQLIGLGLAQQVTVGVAAIIGHNWPIFLRFSGGRGVLTTLGVALVLPAIHNLVPWEAIAGLAIATIGRFILHNTPLGVCVALAALPLVSWASGAPLPIILGFLVMFLIVAIRRLTATRTVFTATVPRGQLLINRLLFDRDIRNREAWIHRMPLEASSAEQPLGQEEKQGKVDYK